MTLRQQKIDRRKKYRRWYRALIEHAKSNPAPSDFYTELHHIRPRCAGGSNSPKNIIRLTARQHIIAHDLLARAYGHRWCGLWGAANFMHRTRGVRVPSRIAAVASEKAKSEMSKKMKGRRPSDETRRKLSESRRGREITEETRKKIAASKTGKPRPDLSDRNRSATGELAPCFGRTGKKHPMFGKSHTEESRKRISEANMGRPGYKRTDLHRRAISEKNQKRDIIYLRSNTLNRSESGTRRELIKKCDIDPTLLSNLIHGKQKTTSGWHLVKVEGKK